MKLPDGACPDLVHYADGVGALHLSQERRPLPLERHHIPKIVDLEIKGAAINHLLAHILPDSALVVS